ncbi:hypothetical protein LHA31_10555 [Carnobacterium viridans]|uniref:hypothetical protein n=1 Tax=Carnobacterium viridans TaxID=174587 RepID=UPI001CFFA43D|nr:hypothetical protein [Carnobacterium viridans]UDE94983.1 hypothetical protein LHA31_10555 [Carnobacterium viridans]
MKKRVLAGIMASMMFASPFLPTVVQADTLEEMEQKKTNLNHNHQSLIIEFKSKTKL